MVEFFCASIYIVSNDFDCLFCLVRYSAKDANIDSNIKSEPNLKIYDHERIERLDTGGNRLNPGGCIKEGDNATEGAILGCQEIVRDFRFLHYSERSHLAKATVGVGAINTSESNPKTKRGNNLGIKSEDLPCSQPEIVLPHQLQ